MINGKSIGSWVKRDLAEKILVRYYRNFEKSVLSSKPIVCDGQSEHEIHMLLCKADALDALWCLKTFYHYSGMRTGLVIHDDGSLDDDITRIFKKHFPGCVIIGRKKADAEADLYLKGYEYCRKFRASGRSPFAIRLFDHMIFSRTKKILMLDSDVLFFRKPGEMVSLMGEGQGFFMGDYQDAYSLPQERLEKMFGIRMRNNVNAGILYLPVERFYDPGLIESFLKAANESGFPHVTWTEQTMWAVFVSKYREVFTRLPAQYQISKQPLTGETISHHYVKDGSRNDFYKKGLKRLKKQSFLRDLAMSF